MSGDVVVERFSWSQVVSVKTKALNLLVLSPSGPRRTMTSLF